jgi:hypothetical protein
MHEHLQKKADMAEKKCLNLQSLDLDSDLAFVNESGSESD